MDINSSTLSFRITLIDLDDLRPHEEIIEQLVTELAKNIQNQGKVRDPLIVDEQSLVILDGMHRYNAMKKLGCRHAPVCLVDYDDHRIEVGAWFRYFNVDDPDSMAKATLEALNQKHERISGYPQNLARSAIITKQSSFTLTLEPDRFAKSQLAVKIERHISGQGKHCEYGADDVVEQRLNSNANMVIPVPIFSKTEIKETATAGRLLPHKVTRHIIPSRPLGLNVPLDLLVNYTREEANEKLDHFLSSRHLDRKPPGSVVDGRRYEEELLVFE